MEVEEGIPVCPQALPHPKLSMATAASKNLFILRCLTKNDKKIPPAALWLLTNGAISSTIPVPD
jgi:hypothetical protein